MSNRNLFTIIAVLAVLPAAKQLVAFIVLFPFKTTQKERYQKAKDMIGEEDEIIFRSCDHIARKRVHAFRSLRQLATGRLSVC